MVVHAPKCLDACAAGKLRGMPIKQLPPTSTAVACTDVTAGHSMLQLQLCQKTWLYRLSPSA